MTVHRALLLVLSPLVVAGAAPVDDPPPPGVEQILPRGRLAAIDQPVYVAAEEALIPDDAWILGVLLDGEARAHDLNLLNRHEVVNGRTADTAYAAVWWPLANTAVVYDRTLPVDGKERELSFEASGALKSATLVLRDRETDSWWSLMSSSAIGGPLEGTALVELPGAEKTTWGAWRAAHPKTLVLSIDGRQHEGRDGYADYWTSERTFRDLEITDRRLGPKEPIFAFRHGGNAYAVAHHSFEDGRLFALGPDAGQIYLYRPRAASVRASSSGFVVPAGIAALATSGEETLDELIAAGAQPLAGFDTYWYSWISIHPDTRLLTRPD